MTKALQHPGHHCRSSRRRSGTLRPQPMRPSRSRPGRPPGTGPAFTASDGQRGAFNTHALTAAHRSLPFGSQVKVTNERTGKSVVVRINDRGPYAQGRVIDLSKAAARAVGISGVGQGLPRLALIQIRSKAGQTGSFKERNSSHGDGRLLSHSR